MRWDRGSGRQVPELVREVSDEQGQTVVMVTHDPLAASYAHSVLFLADGLVVGRLDRADATRIAAAMSEARAMMMLEPEPPDRAALAAVRRCLRRPRLASPSPRSPSC